MSALNHDVRTIAASISLLCAFCAVASPVESWNAAVWRGETAYVDVPSSAVAKMLGVDGAKADGVSVSLAYYDDVAYEMKPNGVDMRTRPDVMRTLEGATLCDNGDVVAPGGKKVEHAVCKVVAAASAKPGVRKFGPLSVTVVDRVLPPAKEWRYFLDLWQHPWAVSRYFGVKPFSKEHYAKMEPIWRTLADCGCKALTVTLLDLPWNHQCYDGYHSMIDREKKTDGTWKFDYTLFDEYVVFGRKCGLGPDIACYTMCPWGYRATWRDANGANRREKLLPGTTEFEEYWGPFLVDFAKHLKDKGWFSDAYIAMDERSPRDVKLICDLIQKKAPGMKVAMAGNKSPSEFEGITIDNYCQGPVHLRKHPKFLEELEPRRKVGFKTTFYVCCSPAHPNTFMESPADEGYWLGAYPVMVGFDGFLRWAANSWPKDPYKDASFKTKSWKAGDTFFVYPGGELSSRMVSLRAGVVAAEKMRILKESGKEHGEIEEIASRYGYKAAVNNGFDFSAFRREVEAFVNGCTSAR